MDLQQIKNHFRIIGNSPELNRAIEVAMQVAVTDLSVLITGESGVGKEFVPQIVHYCSARKHNDYIAVNCGAIPEGTIDSELFGHEKGSFTGAIEARKGYFEVADGGTLFLDEVAELPLSTQVRLLRVLQTGEFIKVGSSKVQKTNVRVIAATNVNLRQAIAVGKFREDLYYRLSTVPVRIPALRERPEDIHLLFRHFAVEFADKYKVPAIKLQPDAVQLLEQYRWPGNVRQLKSIVEQISVLETGNRMIDVATLAGYIPQDDSDNLPALTGEHSADYMSDRDIIFKILFQLKQDVDHLKELVGEKNDFNPKALVIDVGENAFTNHPVQDFKKTDTEENTSTLSIQDSKEDLIKKALEKYKGKRKDAAAELGISERTLYRKIKELGLE
ncbi:MAG: sigma-54-dependent Fis family transcriptional regulator [Bacteroidales bacterium]|nr:sigma-54-dependent Fis family transcriptional regulator [Bacteroidales bacterium]